MSGSDYGNLGNEMKAMKEGRESLVAETGGDQGQARPSGLGVAHPFPTLNCSLLCRQAAL